MLFSEYFEISMGQQIINGHFPWVDHWMVSCVRINTHTHTQLPICSKPVHVVVVTAMLSKIIIIIYNSTCRAMFEGAY